MIVRCGRCGVQFQVPGTGRFACPSCGATNEVRAASPGGAPPGYPGAGGPVMAPEPPLGPEGGPSSPPPEPARPSPRRHCPSCEFTFIVGDIEVATCPNCGGDVPREPE